MRSLSLLLAVMCLFGSLACGGSSGGSTNNLTTTPPTPINLKVTGATPMVAASQVAGGSWSALTLSGSSATFNVPSPSSVYAVAVLCPLSFSNTQIEAVFEASASDTTSPTIFCPSTTSVTMTVNFDVSAIAGAQEAAVVIGNDISAYWNGPTSAANVQDVTTGTQDVAVAAYGPTPTTPPFGVEIQRGVNVTGAPLTIPSMTTNDATGSATITLNGVPSGYSSTIAAWYDTPGGATVPINGNNVPSYALIASADTASGDFYSVEASADNGGSIVETLQTFATPQNLTLSLPAPISYSGPTPNAYPTFDDTYSGFTGSGNTGWLGVLDWANGANTNAILVFGTSAFLGSNSVAIPNLSSVTGFLTPASSGTTVDWSVVALQQSAYFFAFDTASFPSNETAQYAIATGTFTEP